MALIPLNDHLLLRRCERPTVTTGGVHLPENASAREADEAVVIDEGPYPELKGKRVVFRAYGGSEVEIDGEKLILLPYKNIFGVYDEDHDNG